MEIVSVALIVLPGLAISSAFARLLFRLQYDLIVVASSVTLFGGVLLSLMLFLSLGRNGIFLTALFPMMLHTAFMKLSLGGVGESKAGQRWGRFYRFYWAILLTVFTVAGLKSWIISVHIGQVYSLSEGFFPFYFAFGIFLLAGSVSLLMMILEFRGNE